MIFVKDEKLVLELNNFIKEHVFDVNLIAVTFPANEIMYVRNEADEIKEVIPAAAAVIRDLLEKEGVQLIKGSLPFEGIVIPGENYNPYKIVEQTFNIVLRGLANAIQIVLVATDTGAVMPGERVVSMNTATSIDARGANARLLLHPELGIKIEKLL